MPEESCNCDSNVLSGTADFGAEDEGSNRRHGDGRQAVDEEGAGDDHERDVPEPEGQEYLFVDDVLRQDAEAVNFVNAPGWGDELHHAAYSIWKKKIW